jgi:hypothetical protein
MPQTRTGKKRDSEAADDATDKKGDEQPTKPTEEPEDATNDNKTEPTLAGKTEDDLESEPKRQKTEDEDAGENKGEGESRADEETAETTEGDGDKGIPKVDESSSDPVETKKVQEAENGTEQQKVSAAEA